MGLIWIGYSGKVAEMRRDLRRFESKGVRDANIWGYRTPGRGEQHVS